MLVLQIVIAFLLWVLGFIAIVGILLGGLKILFWMFEHII